jgi:hypothetical protein
MWRRLRRGGSSRSAPGGERGAGVVCFESARELPLLWTLPLLARPVVRWSRSGYGGLWGRSVGHHCQWAVGRVRA